ncbi:MAG: CcmD family protein [Acidobacteriales bacterium]|nr:MAG: CcmD family protein [Terriglobales bacterium]
MDSRNFTFLVYGLVAAWLILFAYVAAVAARERKISREIENLKQILKDQKGN